MAHPRTRSRQVMVPVLNTPAGDFSGRQLPTMGKVMSCFIYVRDVLASEATNRKVSKLAVAAEVTERLLKIWNAVRLPTVTARRITKLMLTHYDKLMTLHEYPQVKRATKGGAESAYEKRVAAFQSAAKSLFDISSCKCVPQAQGKMCSCVAAGRPWSSTMGAAERRFLADQRCERTLLIGREDKQRTARENQRLARIATRTQGRKRRHEEPRAATAASSTMSSFDSKSSGSPPKKLRREDNEYVPPLHLRGTLRSGKNYAALYNTAATAERFNVSDRAAAAVVLAYAVDIGIVTETDRAAAAVVDPTKIRRQRTRVAASENQRAVVEAGAPVSIYFDGRKNSTLVKETVEGTSKSRNVAQKENHIVILVEPGSRFIGHVVPKGSLAKDEADAILSGLESRGIPTTNLKAVGCDGTSYNTGKDRGVIACIEKKLGRPLQRNICLLHANELPSRRLLEELDGPTNGPEKWTGPIGKQLETCETMPVCNFKRIPVVLPPVDVDVLSWEQRHLYNLCEAISSGNCPAEVAARNCGKLYHGRWTTANCRILRVYISTTKPSATLKILTEYIVKVYAVLWFSIRRDWLATSGPHHLSQHISLSRCLPKRAQKIIFESLAINAYYAHPENILLSMVVDPRQDVREVAVRRILEARQSRQRRVRQFVVPDINFQAEDYVDLINWDTTTVTAPPLLSDLADEAIENMITTVPDVPRLPCHTQAVERKVHDMTQAAARVVGEERRDGRVNSTITARTAMPKFKSKTKFRAPYEN